MSSSKQIPRGKQSLQSYFWFEMTKIMAPNWLEMTFSVLYLDHVVVHEVGSV